eukprot:153342-Heterocapsa_arctica.AAC.1
MNMHYVFHNVAKVTVDPCLGQCDDEPLARKAQKTRHDYADDKEEATFVEGGERGAEMALAADLGGL